MKLPDLDRIRSERALTLPAFLAAYNEGLPATFPPASASVLREYKKKYPNQFKADGLWSLDVHRKKVMDWLPAHLKALAAIDA